MPALVAGIHVLRNAGGLTRRGWPGQPSRLMAARPAMTTGSVLLHDALAAGGLEAAAHLGSVVLGRERPDLGAVVHALVAEIGTTDYRLPAAEHGRVLGLQRLERCLGFGLAALRSDLHDVAAGLGTDGRGPDRRGLGRLRAGAPRRCRCDRRGCRNATADRTGGHGTGRLIRPDRHRLYLFRLGPGDGTLLSRRGERRQHR